LTVERIERFHTHAVSQHADWTHLSRSHTVRNLLLTDELLLGESIGHRDRQLQCTEPRGNAALLSVEGAMTARSLAFEIAIAAAASLLGQRDRTRRSAMPR